MTKKKLKILFINPVIRSDDSPKHIPYGMAQLAAIAIGKKHRLQVLDANALRPSDNELCEAIASDDWDIIATGGLITTYAYVKKTVRYAKSICPEAVIIAGGGFLSAIPNEIMALLSEIDVGVIGEGVLTFQDILERISEGESDFSDVRGIILRDKDSLKLTGERALLENVDSLPFPAYEMFPMDIYFKNSSVLLSEEAMQAKRRIDVLASYGCIFKCKFCFHLGLSGEIKIRDSGPVIDFKERRIVRSHSPGYMIDLIKSTRSKFNIDFVSFLDENFVFLDRLTGGKWTADFFDLWEKENFVPNCVRQNSAHNPKTCNGIHWGATAHASLVNEKLLNKMRNMGCSHLDYGFESFNNDILKSIGKGATAEINERALRLTMKSGIRPIPNQIVGFPDESFASMKESMLAWRRLGIKTYPFFATPYPGAEWYVKYKEKILSQYDGNLEDFLLDLGDATKITAVISKRFSAVELLGLRELMVKGDIKRVEEYEKLRDVGHWRRNS